MARQGSGLTLCRLPFAHEEGAGKHDETCWSEEGLGGRERGGH